jgi:hypothetical protein
VTTERRHQLAPDVATLLREHGLGGAVERPAPGGGYTGSTMTIVEQGGRRFWLKRISGEPDWIRRATDDRDCREALIAISPLLDRMPPEVDAPFIGAARDGDGFALLLRDVPVIPDDGSALDEAALDAILAAAASLHAVFWDDDLEDPAFPMYPPIDRVLMLTPALGESLTAQGIDFGIARGWRVFHERAPARAVRLVDALLEDPSPLAAMLDALPVTLAHGDLKVSNIAVDGTRVSFIDWQGATYAPVAVELAWFLSVNSSRLPLAFEEILKRYGRMLRSRLGERRWQDVQWEAQLGLVAICGLLMYGWGKALDAEAARPAELAWWCERAAVAADRFGLGGG